MSSIKLSIFGAAVLLTAQDASAQATLTLNTWFSATHGDHITTSDPRWNGNVGDVRAVGGGSGYVLIRREGQVFNPDLPRPPGTVPLVSFFNGTRSDNFTTSDPRWTGLTEANGYRRIRLEGFISTSSRPGSSVLRSFWSPSRGDNYTSTDPRLALPLEGAAGENTRSVEGGRYTHYRVEGFVSPPPIPTPAPPRPALFGLADMHTHPMAHLGFGKKLIHGAPDAFPDGIFGPPDGIPDGSILPAGTHHCNPSDTRAASIDQALGNDNSTHGGHGFFSNPCGNYTRNRIIQLFESANGAHSAHGEGTSGWPAFVHWPRFNDITHQQMWVDWVRRAHGGGLRVMVALAVNNSTLGRLVKGDPPLDDRSAGNQQLRELQAFVRRHSDFMELAFSSVQLRDIVRRNKLAVVLGVELDDTSLPGTVSRAAVTTEVARLRSLGVRYVFPIHLTNNRFGGTAAYQPLFNVPNRVQTGSWWSLECSATVGQRVNLDPGVLSAAEGELGELGAPAFPDCIPGHGHRNRVGLSPVGSILIDVLMRNGMLIDVDHMSERATDQAIGLARAFPSGWGYPLVSGHNGPRGAGGSERALRPDQLEAIRDLGGMLGLGWADTNAASFHANLRAARELMGPGRIAFGSDTNGLSKLPGPRPGTTISGTWSTGGRTWDYRVDGVAQYGMLPEFVRDLSSIDSAVPPADRAGVPTLFNAAESFARTWERAELSGRTALPP